VWTEEEQWLKLWEDILTVLQRVLTRPPGSKVRGHFLGSVVLEQRMSGFGSVESRAVIDGQQRLTTLQVVLRAAAHTME
jgi:uncharacterized protein with ParB-like and HNH nuclease domain